MFRSAPDTLVPMISVLVSLLLTVRGCLRARAALQLEVLALRHQLQVLNRSRPHRLRLLPADRWLWTWLSRLWPAWWTALVIVRPETVLAWHRQGCLWFWTRQRRRQRVGRPAVAAEVRALIRSMSASNPLWGAPRIHGELMRVGSTSRRRPSRSTWSDAPHRHRKRGARSSRITFSKSPRPISSSCRRQRACTSPISRPTIIVDVGVAGHPTAVRDASPQVAALRSALSTRRDLLLETLALRHQLGILARSDRRFRPPDRLLWLILRRLWPRWRQARVLVQPATIDRWHREGFRRCWRRRARRPGRPRIDVPRRDLIRRLARESSLGRSADSRRVPEARNRRLGTHGLALAARPTDATVTDLAYRSHKSPRRPGVRLADDVIVRVGR